MVARDSEEAQRRPGRKALDQKLPKAGRIRFDLIPVFGVSGAVLLSQAIFWDGVSKTSWWWKSDRRWADEMCCSIDQVRRMRRRVIALGALETRRRSRRTAAEYRVNYEVLWRLLDQHYEKNQVIEPTPEALPRVANSPHSEERNRTTESGDFAALRVADSPHWRVAISPPKMSSTEEDYREEEEEGEPTRREDPSVGPQFDLDPQLPGARTPGSSPVKRKTKTKTKGKKTKKQKTGTSTESWSSSPTSPAEQNPNEPPPATAQRIVRSKNGVRLVDPPPDSMAATVPVVPPGTTFTPPIPPPPESPQALNQLLIDLVVEKYGIEAARGLPARVASKRLAAQLQQQLLDVYDPDVVLRIVQLLVADFEVARTKLWKGKELKLPTLSILLDWKEQLASRITTGFTYPQEQRGDPASYKRKYLRKEAEGELSSYWAQG